MNGAPQFQQNNTAGSLPLSHHPTYDSNQPQGCDAHQPQAWATPYGSTANQMYNHIPMQSQEATHTFSYTKPHPQQSIGLNTSSFSDSIVGEDLYNDSMSL
jgi:hypothetical protein